MARSDLGAFYRDVYKALSYVPPSDEPIHSGQVVSHLHRTGPAAGTTMHWWACLCGAHGVTADAAEAQRDLDAHLGDCK